MRAALAFLTILPVGAPPRPPGRAALLAFPLVGVVIGAAWAAIGWAVAGLWGPQAAAGLILIADLLLTGALHLDAFADMADAVASHRRGKEGIAVMRDPTVGAVGAAALMGAYVLRFAFLAALIAGSEWRRIAVAPIAGRVAMVYVLARARRAPVGSLAAGLSTAASLLLAAMTTLLALGMALAAAGRFGVASILSSTLIAEGSAAFIHRRFGQLTGDACGATGLVAETATLAIVSAGVGGS